MTGIKMEKGQIQKRTERRYRGEYSRETQCCTADAVLRKKEEIFAGYACLYKKGIKRLLSNVSASPSYTEDLI